MLNATMRLWREVSSDREMARRSERWGFWAFITGVMAIVVSTGVAIWAVRRSEALTTESGALDKPQPSLYLQSTKVDKLIRVYVAMPLNDKGVTLAHLPLIIRNDGKKTTKGIEVVIREPAFLAVDNQLVEASIQSTLPLSTPPQRYFSTIGKYSYASFSLPDLHPGQAIGIEEPFLAEDSKLEVTGHALSKDGKPISYGLSIVVGIPITVSIAGEDLHTGDYELEVLGLRAKNEEEALSALKEILGTENHDLRRHMKWWRRAIGRIAPLHERVLLITPEYEVTTVGPGERLYAGKDIGSVKAIEYTMP